MEIDGQKMNPGQANHSLAIKTALSVAEHADEAKDLRWAALRTPYGSRM